MKTTKLYSVLAIAGLNLAVNNLALAHQTNINLTPSFSSGTDYDVPVAGAGTLAYDPSGSLHNSFSALGVDSTQPGLTNKLSPSVPSMGQNSLPVKR